MSIKIGLSGRSGAGKTTVARFLKDCLSIQNKDISVMSFADPIREEAFKRGLDIKKPYPPETREFLVRWGQEKRKEDKDYFVDIMKIRLMDADRERRSVIIDDVRFVNEAELLHGLMFKIYFLDISEEHIKRRMGDDYVPPDNEAEIQLPKIKELPFVETIYLDDYINNEWEGFTSFVVAKKIMAEFVEDERIEIP